MKKIVYFITVFTMLCGGDSEARLPKSQGLVAADLLLTKANIKGQTRDRYKTFIIDTIYTTKGRNDFADWMKKAYNDCTYTCWQPKSTGQTKYKKPSEGEINNYNQVREWKEYRTCCYYNLGTDEAPSFVKCCHDKHNHHSNSKYKIGTTSYNDSYNNQIAGITPENPNQKPSVIKLANAFFPCWTGTFTAFFISANSKNCWRQYKDDSTDNAAADVINVSGAPSLWVLSDSRTDVQAERYNALLSQCNNLVEKILWVMFVLETVDNPEVISNILDQEDVRTNWSIITTPSNELYSVVPVPNTFYISYEKKDTNPPVEKDVHGTCMISTILNVLNVFKELSILENDKKILNTISKDKSTENVEEQLSMRITIDDGVISNVPGLTSPNRIKHLMSGYITKDPSFIKFVWILCDLFKTNHIDKINKEEDGFINAVNAANYNDKDKAEKNLTDFRNTTYGSENFGMLVNEVFNYLFNCSAKIIQKIEDKKTTYFLEIAHNAIAKKQLTIKFSQSGRSAGDYHMEIIEL